MQDAGYVVRRARQVPLRQDGALAGWALIDEADWPLIKRYDWYLTPFGYACTPWGASRWRQMHRMLLDAPDGLHVDHRNMNKVDNRRSNLRLVTQAQNCQNLKARRGGTSEYRGVCWDKQKKKWKATVGLNYKTHNLGHFDDEHEAGRVAAEFRAVHMPFSEEAACAPRNSAAAGRETSAAPPGFRVVEQTSCHGHLSATSGSLETARSIVSTSARVSAAPTI